MTTGHWTLDKRIPIALVATIFMQSAYAVWWASGVSERLAQIERRQENAGQRSEVTDRALAEQGRQTAVLSEALSNTNRNLERIQSELTDTNRLLRDVILGRNGQ